MQHVLLSKVSGRLFDSEKRVVYTHAINAAKHPDINSEFDTKNRDIRLLPGPALILMLLQRGYEGLVFLNEDASAVDGHVFFQVNGDAAHMFSIYVRKDLRDCGMSTLYVQEFLTHLYEHTPIRRVRLGAGGHAAVKRLWLNARNFDLTFHVISEVLPDPEKGEEGWIRLAAA